MSNKARVLVTHESPHLDDIVAIWLFARFYPRFADAKLAFIKKSAGGGFNTYHGEPIDSNPNVVHFGTGMGKYDEHKGNLNDCATTLAYKELKRRKLIPKLDQEALAPLIAYVLDDDQGKIDETASFNLVKIVNGVQKLTEDSKATAEFAIGALDGILLEERVRVTAERAWARRREFRTPWGKGMAVSTATGTKALSRIAYRQGFVLSIYINREKNYRGLVADANSKVNLTKAYSAVKKLEPKADWYLHQSKKMLLCGSDVATNKHLSKLSLDTLIALVTS